jgi:hypothetical protein
VHFDDGPPPTRKLIVLVKVGTQVAKLTADRFCFELSESRLDALLDGRLQRALEASGLSLRNLVLARILNHRGSP